MGAKRSVHNSGFARYRNMHGGSSAVIFATGPSLNQFSFDLIPERDSDLITIGVSQMVYHPSINLDYYFCGQSSSKENTIRNKARKNNLLNGILNFKEAGRVEQIFCNDFVDDKQHRDHFKSKEAEAMRAITFDSTHHWHKDSISLHDIHKHRLFGHMVIFPPIQFAIYAGCKKIYLVGCDGYSRAKDKKNPGPTAMSFIDLDRELPDSSTNARNMKVSWMWMKKAIKKHAPDIQIININPVMLKGEFDKDIFHGQS